MTCLESFDQHYSAHFPLSCGGRPVVVAHPLIEAPHLRGFACSLCGGVHLVTGTASLQVTGRRCTEDEVAALAGEPMTYEALAGRGRGWVAAWDRGK